MNHYNHLLSQTGLTDNQVTIYSLLLRKGAMLASAIAKETGMQRGSVYFVLDSLVDEGLVEKSSGGKTKFSPTHPSQLDAFINKRKQHLNQIEKSIQTAMPTMLRDFNLVSKKPGVYAFSGIEGTQKVFNRMLDDKLDVCGIEDTGSLYDLMPEYEKMFMEKSQEYKMQNRAVIPSTSRDQVRKFYNAAWEHRFLQADQFSFNMVINITDKNVIMATVQEETSMGVVIIHDEIVKNYKVLFELLWSISQV